MRPRTAAVLAATLIGCLGIVAPVGATPFVTSGLIAFVREGPDNGIYTMTPMGSDLIGSPMVRITGLDGHRMEPRSSSSGSREVPEATST